LAKQPPQSFRNEPCCRQPAGAPEQIVEWRRQGRTLRQIRQLLDLDASVPEGVQEVRVRMTALETLVRKVLSCPAA
jgi:hypothetical protein